LVVAIGRAGRDIPVESANEHVWGYAVGPAVTCSSNCATRAAPGNWARPSINRHRSARWCRHRESATRPRAQSGSG
jgi:hypothetical protein